jgi:hypothetical protein
MIWAALLIGTTVLFAAMASRSSVRAAELGSPLHWLVLPDEPTPMEVLALPRSTAARTSLPAVVVTCASWTKSDESWRAEKPLRSWFRGPGPIAVAAAMGAVSLDLTALGMGVPEIFPTHATADRHETAHGHTGPMHAADLFGSDAIALPAMFEAPHAAGPSPVSDHFALGGSDFIVPSWHQTDHASHDWMA